MRVRPVDSLDMNPFYLNGLVFPALTAYATTSGGRMVDSQVRLSILIAQYLVHIVGRLVIVDRGTFRAALCGRGDGVGLATSVKASTIDAPRSINRPPEMLFPGVQDHGGRDIA